GLDLEAVVEGKTKVPQKGLEDLRVSFGGETPEEAHGGPEVAAADFLKRAKKGTEKR
ncbi:hypothetical protein ENH_00010590, partial [Eimeria necatrix]